MGAHVGGQVGRQVAVELLVGQVVTQDEERQQFVGALRARAARAHVGPLDRRVGENAPFHLAGFDPEAADLDLAVGSSDVLHQALVVGPYEVSGAVVPLLAAVEPRQPHEAPLGLLGKVAVPDGQSGSAQQEFADLTGRGDPFLARYDQDRTGLRQRPADRHHVPVELPRDRVAQGEGGGLRRPVHVEQTGAAVGVVPVPAAHHPGVELFPAHEHLAGCGEAVGHGRHHGVEQGRGDEDGVHALVPQRPGEPLGVLHVRIAQDHAAAAGQQGRPHFEAERVERRIGQAGIAPTGLDTEGAGLCQAQDSGVLDLDSLGLSRRSGGVEEERRRAGRGRCLHGVSGVRKVGQQGVRVECLHVRRRLGDALGRLVHQGDRSAVPEDEAAPFGGALGVQGHDLRPQPQDAQHHTDKPPRPRQRHRHGLPRGDALAPQLPGDGGGCRVQRRTVEGDRAVDDRLGPRCAQGSAVYFQGDAGRGAHVRGHVRGRVGGGCCDARFHRSSHVPEGVVHSVSPLAGTDARRCSSAVRTAATRGSSSLSSMSQ